MKEIRRFLKINLKQEFFDFYSCLFYVFGETGLYEIILKFK